MKKLTDVFVKGNTYVIEDDMGKCTGICYHPVLTPEESARRQAELEDFVRREYGPKMLAARERRAKQQKEQEVEK